LDKKLLTLYGKIDPSRLDKEFKISSKSASLVSPGADLQFALSADGVFTLTPAKASASQGWSVRIVPSQSGWSESAQLYKGGSFVSLRVPNLEQGASTFADTTKHFFLLSKGGSYSLKFEVPYHFSFISFILFSLSLFFSLFLSFSLFSRSPPYFFFLLGRWNRKDTTRQNRKTLFQ
jgi:hypothetical protein